MALQCQSVVAGPAPRARGPRRLPLTSVAGSERGKERTDSHYGVQTIWQGRGSAGAVSGARTYDIVGLTYNIVYDVTYDIVRTIGKNRYLTYDVTYDIVRRHNIVYDIVGLDTISYPTSYTILNSKYRTRCHILYTM